MEVVVPVGVLDDDLHLGVHFLGGIDHKFAACISHEAQTVFCPALAALLLGGYLVVVLQVDEEEVVEDEVVEELCRVLSHLFHLLALVLTGVAVGLEVGGL